MTRAGSMVSRRIAVALLCVAALPASAEDLCPDRFQILGWPGGPFPGRDLRLADFEGGALVVTASEVADAQPGFDHSGAPAVQFRLTARGSKAFAQFTSGHIGEPMALVVDEDILTAPVIREAIVAGQGMITGRFTVAETNNIATILREKTCNAGS